MTEGRTGERATGTPNTIYDLSSVLFHALEGGASYDQYIQDAEEEGDQELADFFRRVRDEDSSRADEAQRLLAERTPTATTGRRTEGTAVSAEGVAAGAPPPRTEQPVVGGAAPGTEGIMPPRAEEAPPRTEETPPRTEEVSPRAEEAPLPEEHERARQAEREREGDKGLIDRAIDKLTGQEEPGREGTDRRT
ncbi:MAG: hypothetical protein M3246_05475 [Actinomycetota bacterium]|nr:hypothetical protein [Actinomycetota bacterium]